jgi:hypothetical protein
LFDFIHVRVPQALRRQTQKIALKQYRIC